MIIKRTKRTLGGCVAALAALPLVATGVMAQDVADVPRENTLVLTPWGDQPAQHPNVDNWNPYLISVVNRRNAMHVTVNEALFYTNLNTGELVPWIGERFEYADDFTSATITLRDGVTWADGEAFDAEDVKFTLEAVRDAPPEVFGAASFGEWVADVEVVDPLTARVNFTKPAPRWIRDHLALGHENHYPLLAEHLWRDKSLTEFTNFDIEAGYPLGTGAYKLVSATSQQFIFDRRDDWWGAATGFEDLPAPERIVIVPVASEQAMGQLHIANQVDGGRQLLIGTFEAARIQNPNLASWNPEGPVWGAADGCVYTLKFNNKREPWNDRNLRWAVNHALDRSILADIAYEGSMPTVEFAFASFLNETYLNEGDALPAVVAEFGLDNQSQELVDQYMAEAGFERNADGLWAQDGEVLDFLVRAPAFIQPLLAPMTQQLRQAGFNANQAPVDDSWLPDVRTGDYETMIFVHCGSLSEPLETLQHFHSRFSRPLGEGIPSHIAATRYENPELDPIIDRMLAVPASNDPESAYMQDAVEALRIVIDDLPQIHLIEEFHVVTFNNTYWTGWPSRDNPYVAPYTPWSAFNLIVHNLQPAR